jgi:hypothetical protein
MKRALFLFLVSLFASMAAAGTISLDDYRNQLGRVDRALALRDTATARNVAAQLLTQEVRWSGGTFLPDRSVLEPIASAKELSPIAARREVATTLAALSSLKEEVSPPTSDQKLLSDLRRSEEIKQLKRGGEISTVPMANEGLWAEVGRRIAEGWKWLGDQLMKFWEWLASFWPDDVQAKRPTFFGVPFTVAALVLIIVAILLLLAMEMWRRGRKAPQNVVESETLSSSASRDDDPLSRETNEWERYANELAAAGRIREAIRAWYHAVLVAIFRAGLVQYRKGRTNWEYVSALPSTLPWRSAFSGLTRLFDREWYGRDRSSIEALESCAADSRRLLETIRRSGARA